MKKISNSGLDPNAGDISRFSRRGFIYSCSACAACMAAAPLSFVASSCSGTDKKMKIRILYSLHAAIQAKPDWPNLGYNFNPVMDQIHKTLSGKFRNMEFIPTLSTGPEESERIVEQDKQEAIDGYIVFQMNCWNRVVQTVAKTGKPLIYADYEYAGSGGFLVYTSGFLNAGAQNVGFVSSSRMEDLVDAVNCFNIIGKGGTTADFVAAVTNVRLKRTPAAGKYVIKSDPMQVLSPEECIKRLSNSKILAVKDQETKIAGPVMGIPLEYIAFSELNDAWSKADKDEAAVIARQWQERAREVIEVPFETLVTSAAMYLGMKSVLQKHAANAITVNCLGGFYGGHIHAYPCLAFHELCNEGLVGGCECDIKSAATMVAFNIMTNGRPGYISDPVIDTAKRQIIYAHCVASNKVFGPMGETNPYVIMTHSEDRAGAAVRSVMPLNYLTSTLKIDDTRKEIIFHQAVAVDNDPDDRACRTKLCAEPLGDIEKLFTTWKDWGWHRVTFYGDLKEPVEALAGELGWKVVREA